MVGLGTWDNQKERYRCLVTSKTGSRIARITGFLHEVRMFGKGFADSLPLVG